MKSATLNHVDMSISLSRKKSMIASKSILCRAALVISAVAALNAVGCGTGSSGKTATTSVAATRTLTGKVHGGQNPVTGASIYLFAVGTTGYGSTSSSLLTSSTGNVADSNGYFYALTDGNGNFSITGDYSCPTSTSLVYMVSEGGNTGSGAANPESYLVAALGNCQNLLANAATTSIWVDEETTIAAAYALAPFTSAIDAIGASGTNLTGITNAFAEAANLVNTTTGAAYQTTPSGNGTVPYLLINSLSNALAVCVNSSGAVTGGTTTPCDMLFSPTTVNGVVPANTFMAAVSMAQNPSHNASALVQLGSASSPFQPTLTSVNDLTVAIAYTGSGISTPQAIAIDSAGNAWIANAGSNAITELSAGTGASLSGSTGYTTSTITPATNGTTTYPLFLDAPISIGIDFNGNVWVGECAKYCSGSTNYSNLTILTPGTTITGGSSGIGNGIPYGFALDGVAPDAITPSMTVTGAYIERTNLTTVPAPPQEHALDTGDYLGPVSAVVIDRPTTGNENAYFLSPSYNAVSVVSGESSTTATTYYQGAGISVPVAGAVDSSHYLWIVNGVGNSISVLNTGAPITGSPFTGGGLSSPNSIAMDGSGSAWVANGNGSVTQLSHNGIALSPSAGYQPGASHANGIAVDAAGSIWVTDCGSICSGSGTSVGAVYQIIGAGTPVVTPLSLALNKNTVAAKP